MTRSFISPVMIVLLMVAIIFSCASIVYGEPKHGIAMYGKPDLSNGYSHLPYANPKAVQGGKIIIGETGGFDSLNPYILKGRAPWGIRLHTVESLMGRSYDEPFSLYGLLAETIEVGPNREWVSFTLRKNARFSNGEPVTIQDVLWSFETLATLGHPRYSNSWKKVEKTEQTGPNSLKITFNTIDRELPLILGLRPILRKADWEGRPFDESSLKALTGSGPYIINNFEPNRYISFKRNPDYWGQDLPFNKGRNSLDEIRYDYFIDSDVMFEAFKAGETNFYRENNAGKWETLYNFPRITDGEITKSIIPNKRPSGIRGFVMNTRRDKFADIRVRDALIHAFNFEFINKTINGVPQPRISSYFSNSILGMEQGLAAGKTKTLLEPFQDQLPTEVLSGYRLPNSDGSKRNRKNLRMAQKLFKEAGWNIKDGILQNAQGTPFTIDVLLRSGSINNEAIINIYADALKRLGVTVSMSIVDSAQYTERANSYDFDITDYRRALSLSPGNEQKLYWGAEGVTKPGTRNYMGMDVPAAEAMIEQMLSATNQTDFIAAVKALDRILISGRYVIPLWYNPVSYLAHDTKLKYPESLPMYGDWPGFMPDVWWWSKE